MQGQVVALLWVGPEPTGPLQAQPLGLLVPLIPDVAAAWKPSHKPLC